VSGSVTVISDYRTRGYSLSQGDPALTFDLGYDHESGAYANASAIVGVDGSDPALIGYQANLGYAMRIGRGVSIDAGVLRTQYTRHSSFGREAHYTEFYVGAAMRGLSARAYLSPDYFQPSATTLYTEIEGVVRPLAGWRLDGHVGLLTHLGEPPPYTPGSHSDWRMTVGRELGKLDLRVSLSGSGPGSRYYGGRGRDGTALTAAATFSF